MMSYFFNVTAHPSTKWSTEQLHAAHGPYAESIVDMGFPQVPPTASREDVQRMAQAVLDDIKGHLHGSPASCRVLVQGEMTLVYALVGMLKAAGHVPVAACSERKSVETQDASGATVKRSVFSFVGFRPY